MTGTLRKLQTFLALLLLFVAQRAHAHEFWMLPDRFAAPADSTVSLSLSVGENFVGERVGISSQLVSRFTLHAHGRRTELLPDLPASPAASFQLRLRGPGGYLLAMDTHPSEVELPADKFNEYLQAEGLTRVLRQREADGTSQQPGRERYRRNIKTLVQVGNAADRTFAHRTGQRLEIIPVADPARLRSGERVAFRVVFDARPLAGALVKFWHRERDTTVASSAVTSADGLAAFQPGLRGTWMVSVVHMIPAPAASGFDWDSFWGNLTFELPK